MFVKIAPAMSAVLRGRFFSTQSPAKPAMHFLGANGYPICTYTPFLAPFEPKYAISTTDIYNHVSKSWQSMIDVVLKDIEKTVAQDPTQKKGVTLVGHSLGGAIGKCCAAQRPDLIDTLIIIDAPMFGLKKRLVFWAAQKMGNQVLDKLLAPARFAMTRREVFTSIEDARQYYAGLKLYASLDQRCMEGFFEKGIIKDGDKYRLAFTIADEVQIYRSTPPDILPPYRGSYAPIKSKGAYLFSSQYPLVTKEDIDDLRERLKPFPFIPFPEGHFYPLQKPDEAAQWVMGILDSIQKGK